MSGQATKIWSQNASWGRNVTTIGGLVQHIGVDDIKGSLAGTQISNWQIQSDRLALIEKLHKDTDKEQPCLYLMNLVELVRSSDAGLAHDKICSVLGFLDPEWTSNIISDYERSVAEVYKEFCLVWIMSSQNLDFLRNCLWTDNPTFPSWVPDWSIKSIPRLLPVGICPNPYRAGGDWISVNVPPGGTLLATEIIIAGVIDGLSMCEEHIEGDMISQPKGYYNYYGERSEAMNEETIRDTLRRTFLGNCMFDFQVPEPEFGEFRALLDIPLPERVGGRLPSRAFRLHFLQFYREECNFADRDETSRTIMGE